jgi:hypothetical protein
MKADRVVIGSNYASQPAWKRAVGVPLIYIPLLVTMPFVALGVLLVQTHLRFVGGMNIRPYRDEIPVGASHRYRLRDQITYATDARWYNLRAQRWYWIFNCKLYCPLSVGLFDYAAYLVKIVENWCCPFDHDRKPTYREGAIDKSYWHLHETERRKLHPQDLDNPIWNAEADNSGKKDLRKAG